tara:strand:+ start:236 stop:436 length:201 start_codon:yes stop_codon:yes gene_type:complete
MLYISRVNIFTGKPEAKTLDCTQSDLDNYMRHNIPIAQALPNLTYDEQEFVIDMCSVAELQRRLQL